jgi:hypothetical protein
MKSRGYRIYIERGKRLIFPHGPLGFGLTIPSSWSKFHNISKDNILKEGGENKQVDVVWCPQSKGYLLYLIPEVVKKNWIRKATTINISQIKNLMVRDYDKSILSEVSIRSLRDFIRLLMGSLMASGFDNITLRYEPSDHHYGEELSEYFHRMYRTNIRMLEESIIEEIYPGSKHEIQISIRKSKENGKEYCEYDFITLTEKLWICHNNLFKFILECVGKGKPVRDLYGDSAWNEGCLDFLWFYALRQLVKCINAGVFCGLKYSGVHVIWLSIIFKIIERNADCLMRILHMLSYLQRKLEKDSRQDKSIESFFKELAEILNKTKQNCDQLKEITMRAIEGRLEEKDKEAVANIIKEYNDVAPKLGEISESYIMEIEGGSVKSNIERAIFGDYLDFIKQVIKNKGEEYGIILSQLLAELRMVIKFPRNVAVGALLLATEHFLEKSE